MENDNATSSEIQRYMDSLPEPDRAEFAAFLTWIAGLTPAQCQDYMDGKLLPSVDNGYSFQRTNVQVGGQSVGASAARGFAGPGQANITPSPVQAGVGPTTRDQRRGVMAFLHVIRSDGLVVLEEMSASSADDVYSAARRQHTTYDGPLQRYLGRD